ncbi:MAG: MerR family transcriptional regulator [Chloroflexota bacterium]
MFKVGDFAKLAQVSTRLLRYYDEIDLLKPSYIDDSSDYRHYTATQMTDLNRILALRDLGFSLSQIRETLDDSIRTEELSSMLQLKKAEIEKQMQAEMRRIRQIEARLQAIENAETNKPPNVIIKQIPTQTVLSFRQILDFDGTLDAFAQIQASLPRDMKGSMLFCMCHDDKHEDLDKFDFDMEIGIIVTNAHDTALTLRDGVTLSPRKLAGSTTIATTVIEGTFDKISVGYSAITTWLGNNKYEIAGNPRELILELPQSSTEREVVTEIQFPITTLE